MRDVPVGNGSLLVTFDEKYQLRDIYFPHVGQENHTEGNPCRFGIWVEGVFQWISDEGWERELRYLPESLVTDVLLRNSDLGIEIKCNDTVASHEDILLRRFEVKDLAGTEREIKLFFHHDLRIYENKFGDTAMYEPHTGSMIHYKKHRYFLIGSRPQFDSFATGRKAFKNSEGTWRDAEDGNLQGGAMTEGSVDSTIGIGFQLGPGMKKEVFVWLCAGTTMAGVQDLHRSVIAKSPEKYVGYTENYWRAWVNKNEPDLSGLPDQVTRQFKRSLLIIHTQIDGHGAILAANDHDVTERATDHYSYLWTRDGAFVAHALDLAGFSHITRKFFRLCGEIVHPDGYFLQKYNPDGTVASGWHASWDPDRKEKLIPIQEDETALVLWSLWEHYDRCRDIEFAHRLYKKMVVPCADFMLAFRDSETGLPQPSWNLWEDRRGIHTFTCCSVIAGLRAAARFAHLFSEDERARSYEVAAEEIKAGMSEYLFSNEYGRFVRSLDLRHDGAFIPDLTIDASMFGTFFLGCFEANDPMVIGTMNAIEEALNYGGGVCRFENDSYMRKDGDPPNAWFICTLWLAEYYIARATSALELKPALKLIEWVAERALPSGVLAEQFNTVAGEHVSVSPLTWSHSTYVAASISYLKKLRSIG